MLPEINLGDHVRLRKAHPCGGYEWEVVRLGADIGWCALPVASCAAHAERISSPHEGLPTQSTTDQQLSV